MMTTESQSPVRIPDLSIQFLDSGNFSLSQQCDIDEPTIIEVHPAQIRVLAEKAGILKAPDLRLLESLGAAHKLRVDLLRERVEELSSGYLDQILTRCGDGVEISLHLRAIEALAYDLLEDLGWQDAPEVSR